MNFNFHLPHLNSSKHALNTSSNKHSPNVSSDKNVKSFLKYSIKTEQLAAIATKSSLLAIGILSVVGTLEFFIKGKGPYLLDVWRYQFRLISSGQLSKVFSLTPELSKLQVGSYVFISVLAIHALAVSTLIVSTAVKCGLSYYSNKPISWENWKKIYQVELSWSATKKL